MKLPKWMNIGSSMVFKTLDELCFKGFNIVFNLERAVPNLQGWTRQDLQSVSCEQWVLVILNFMLFCTRGMFLLRLWTLRPWGNCQAPCVYCYMCLLLVFYITKLNVLGLELSIFQDLLQRIERFMITIASAFEFDNVQCAANGWEHSVTGFQGSFVSLSHLFIFVFFHTTSP